VGLIALGAELFDGGKYIIYRNARVEGGALGGVIAGRLDELPEKENQFLWSELATKRFQPGPANLL
jgi:hypothetical protein